MAKPRGGGGPTGARATPNQILAPTGIVQNRGDKYIYGGVPSFEHFRSQIIFPSIFIARLDK